MKLRESKFFLPLLGAASFIVFLLWTIPAAVGFSLLAPANVRGIGVGGTLWNGQAQLIVIDSFRIQQARWELNPLRLLIGTVAGTATARWDGGSAEGGFAVGIGGSIVVNNARATINLAMLNSLFTLPGISGDVSLRVEQLAWSDGWPNKLIGTGEVRNLKFAMLPIGPDQTLGSYELSFDDAAVTDSLIGRLRDTGGPIELGGTLTLTRPVNYALSARVRARPDAPAPLSESLQLLGPAGPDGGRQFEWSGSL